MTVTSLHPDTLGTLCGLFRARVAATPDQIAYRQFDETRDAWVSFTWVQVAAEVARWQAALTKEGLAPGDRVAVMLKNSVEWVIFDQAALALGLVTVPLYLDDRPENAAYILDHADARLLLVEGKFQLRKLAEIAGAAGSLQRIVSLSPPNNGLGDWSMRFVVASDWLAAAAGTPIPERHLSPDLLASRSGERWRSGIGVPAAAASQSDATTKRMLQSPRPLFGGERLTIRCRLPAAPAISASFLSWNLPSTSNSLASA